MKRITLHKTAWLCNKKAVLPAVLVALGVHSAAEIRNSELVRKFIKGNIAEKTAVVREASDSEKADVARLGLDFVDANAAFLSDDRDLSVLGVASILSLEPNSGENDKIVGKLISIFTAFPDANVRTVILEKIPEFAQDKSTKAEVCAFVNDFLKSDGTKPASVLKNSISALGKIGNEESLRLVFALYTSKAAPQCDQESQAALTALMSKYEDATISLVSSSKISEIAAFFDFVSKSDKITKNYQMNIAETALSVFLSSAGSLQDISQDDVLFQARLLEFISDGQWFHATDVVAKFFPYAQNEYDSGILPEECFISILKSTSAFKSSAISAVLSDCLAGFNGKAEQKDFPSEQVVLAVINCLGALGDKAAFDNLLYVTYLEYPEDVVNAARVALATLKW